MTDLLPAITEQYSLDPQSASSINKELGQGEFLELMMAQLEHQDPMEPMDNGQFLGQMAQFSTVTGIEDMKTSLDNLGSTFSSGQTLQSTQLVGQEVLIANPAMALDEEGPSAGSFELDTASGDVLLDIADSSGNVVRQISLGEFPSGRHSFSWDGLNKDGNRAPPGSYTARISAQRGEEYVSATVLTTRVIDSVEFGNGEETRLNTKQGDALTIADIRQIRQNSNSTNN